MRMQKIQNKLVELSDLKSFIKIKISTLTSEIISFYALLKSEIDLPCKISFPKGNLILGVMGQVSAKDIHV